MSVHWPSDVVAGAAVGVVAGWPCWLATSLLVPRKPRPRPAPRLAVSTTVTPDH
jgi:membrane-associated phospholipid phosphatase